MDKVVYRDRPVLVEKVVYNEVAESPYLFQYQNAATAPAAPAPGFKWVPFSLPAYEDAITRNALTESMRQAYAPPPVLSSPQPAVVSTGTPVVNSTAVLSVPPVVSSGAVPVVASVPPGSVGGVLPGSVGGVSVHVRMGGGGVGFEVFGAWCEVSGVFVCIVRTICIVGGTSTPTLHQHQWHV